MTSGTYQLDLSLTPGATTAPTLYFHTHGSMFTPAGGTPAYEIDTTLPLVIRDASFSGSVIPIDARANVVLDHVTIQNAKHLGVASNLVANDLHISNSVDATAAVIVSGGADFTINGGVIHGNITAISALSGAQVHLTNLLAYGSTARPLELGTGLGDIQFSSIIGGTSSTSAPCALACSASLHVTSSIVWQPTCVDGTPHDAAGPCAFQSSIVSNASAPVGTTNTDPMFVNETMQNYHIQATSPARDAVSTGPATDFEGDARPGGSAFDIGADEIP